MPCITAAYQCVGAALPALLVAKQAAVFALLMTLLLSTHIGVSQPIARQVLLDYKAQVLACNSSSDLAGWNEGKALQEWRGVTTLNGTVTGLALRDFGLCGTLPSSITLLTGLRSLDMSRSGEWPWLTFKPPGMNGTLPAGWSLLTGLTFLNLDYNYITGPLPAAWSTLRGLRQLLMRYCRLDGTMPAAWSEFVEMRNFTMSINRFVGTLPAAYSTMTKLKNLRVLGNRNLQGSLPPEYSRLVNLEVLKLSAMNLSGTLPNSWSNMVAMQDLELLHNNLGGTLPTAWSQLRAMSVLSVTNNSVTGTLPAAWSELRALTLLGLARNHLYGTIPEGWTALSNVGNLQMKSNHFVGTLPPSIWPKAYLVEISNNSLTGALPRFHTSLQYLNMSLNAFTGTIPAIPSSLVYLNLHRNKLTGVMPNVTVGSNIVYIDLSDNMLQALPAQFQAASALYLNVARNQLQGTLPSSGYDHSLVFCDLNSNVPGLSGSIPQSWSNHRWMYLALDRNRLSGDLTQESWRGRINILLLQHNNFTGCLPGEWPQNRSAQIMSFSANNINCLPESWGTAGFFSNLSLLDVPNLPTKPRVPLSWVQPGAFKSNASAGERTVLRLGQSWVSSAEHSRAWRRNVCIQKDLNERLSGYLNVTTVGADVLAELEEVLNIGLAGMIMALSGVNRTFDLWIGVTQVPLRLDEVRRVTPEELCQNPNAVLIVVLQWSLVTSGILAMVILYSCGVKWRLISRCILVRRPRASLQPVLRGTVPPVGPVPRRMMSTWHSARFAISLAVYWYDIISDILLLSQVWGDWPGYALLALFLLQYVVALVVMACRLDIGWKSKCLLVTLGLPFMPLLDTAVCVLLALQPHTKRLLLGLSNEQWYVLFEMREVLEVFLEAIPTSVLQSTVFLLGNDPHIGWFLDDTIYLLSALGSCVQILRLTAVILWESLQSDVSPWMTLWYKSMLRWSSDREIRQPFHAPAPRNLTFSLALRSPPASTLQAPSVGQLGPSASGSGTSTRRASGSSNSSSNNSTKISAGGGISDSAEGVPHASSIKSESSTQSNGDDLEEGGPALNSSTAVWELVDTIE